MAPPRRFRWGFALLGAIFVGLIVWLAFAGRKPASRQHGSPVVPVTVARATRRDMPLYVSALGSAQAWKSVLINPQIDGRLTFVAREGSDVKAGEVLARIDCAPYQATLVQAQGALKRDQAQLAGARADLARYRTLEAQNSIARQTAEDQAATVGQDQGLVLADQGAVAAAKVNVGRCDIASPISGRVGVRLIDPGNIVGTTTTTGIVSVNQITPIAVIFTVPQGDFQRLAEASNAFTIPLATEAAGQESGASLGVGQLVVADNHVDQTTGTVELKSRFENADKRIWPGQFVNVRLTVKTLPNAVTIPSTAVNQGPDGPFVYVVGAGDRVVDRPVKLVATEHGVAVIQSGVEAGETVVTDGQMAVKPGSIVSPRPTAAAGPAA